MEQQILTLHNQGLNYNQIANALGCSRLTVRYHLNPQDKINAKTRVELSRAAKKRAKAKEKEKTIQLPVAKKEKPIKAEKVKPVKKVKRQKNDKKPATRLTRKFTTKDQNLGEK